MGKEKGGGDIGRTLMNQEETDRIDRITATVHYLLKGQIPLPVPIEDDPDDEIRQLSGKVNQLVRQFREIREFIDPLAKGRLDVSPPKANFLASPFKQLHAALSHLTWQTRQIAKGDFDQRVNFMGDFSRSFNAMVEALKETQNRLVAEAERHKSLAELKNHYLNVMAHDIRTPIGAILGFADILLDGDLDPKSRKHIKIIRRNCDNLLTLINNILDMARLEKRKIEISSVPFNLRTLGTDIGELIQPRLAHGVEFRFNMDDALPDWIMGDPQRLQQVLLNLVGNAARFTKNGRVELNIQLCQNSEAEPSLEFSVSDTGIGIAPDQLDRIFDPFIQADGAAYSRFGGTGLGLSIARELAGLMGGELTVESQVGKGTIFRFNIHFTPAQNIDDQDSKIADGRFRRVEGCHILVVDDHPESLQIFARRLERQGVRYALCQKSTQAMKQLISAYEHEDPFTLAWLDIDMPGLNGFQLAERIREDRRFAHLRLVACTSYTDQIDDPDKTGPFSFVATKPLSDNALKHILAEAGNGFETAPKTCELAGRRVLVVDDNPINRFLLKEMLKKLNVAAEEAQDGKEGLAKATNGGFDAVVMDKMMPFMDGVEATARIRAIPNQSRLPILAFTADENGEESQRMLDAGANIILPKTLDLDTLADRLCRVLI